MITGEGFCTSLKSRAAEITIQCLVLRRKAAGGWRGLKIAREKREVGSWKVKNSVRNETLEVGGADLLCRQPNIPLLGNFLVAFCHPEFDVLLI